MAIGCSIPSAQAIPSDLTCIFEPFPGPGARIQISRNGGAQGTWSRDGKQIFFIAPDKKLMAVSFDARRQSVSAPHFLFQTRIIAPNFVTRQYDVAPRSEERRVGKECRS